MLQVLQTPNVIRIYNNVVRYCSSSVHIHIYIIIVIIVIIIIVVVVVGIAVVVHICHNIYN